MALTKKPMKTVDSFINQGGTAPKKEKPIEEFSRLELRVPPEIKKGIKTYAAMRGETMVEVIRDVFLKGCEAYQHKEGFPKIK